MRFFHHTGILCALMPLFLIATAKGDQTENELTLQEKAAGWKLLFDGKTAQGWRSFKKQSFPTKDWLVEDGWLHGVGQGGGDIISDSEFEQFELTWEWKLEPAGNSGLKYFVLETRNSAIGHEYQLLDDQRNPDGKLAEGKRITASFYDVLKPTTKPPTRPMGEVNQSRIVVKSRHVEHWLNGTKVLEYQCGSDALKAAIAQSKFKNTKEFADCVRGHLLLQDHGSNVWFRNIKIREIADH